MPITRTRHFPQPNSPLPLSALPGAWCAAHSSGGHTPWGARGAGDKGLKGTQMCGELILTASTHPSPKTFHRTHTVWAHRRAPGSQPSPVKQGSAIWQVLPLPKVCKARRINWGQVSLPGVCYGKREGLRNLPEITQSGVAQSASFHTQSSVFFLPYLLLRWESSEQMVPDFAAWFQRKKRPSTHLDGNLRFSCTCSKPIGQSLRLRIFH